MGKGSKELAMRTARDKHSRPRARPGQRPGGRGEQHGGGIAPAQLEHHGGGGTRSERKLGLLGAPVRLREHPGLPPPRWDVQPQREAV